MAADLAAAVRFPASARCRSFLRLRQIARKRGTPGTKKQTKRKPPPHVFLPRHHASGSGHLVCSGLDLRGSAAIREQGRRRPNESHSLHSWDWLEQTKRRYSRRYKVQLHVKAGGGAVQIRRAMLEPEDRRSRQHRRRISARPHVGGRRVSPPKTRVDPKPSWCLPVFRTKKRARPGVNT